MRRVALVNLGWGPLFSGRVQRYNRRFPPLCLLNCATLLRDAGVSVALFDQRAEPRALDRLDPNGYDLIAVTLSPLDRWQCPNTDLALAEQRLRHLPRDRLVVMGAQGTIAPEAVLQRLRPHALVLGEPEPAVARLGAGGARESVAGVAWLDGEDLVRTAPSAGLSLADLGIPAFDLLDFHRYRYEVLGNRFGLLELSRGCPWRCRFCLLAMYPRKVRSKTPDQMVAEVRAAWALGMRRAYFQDLEFTLDHERVRALCDGLLRAGLPLEWACQTRPDTVDRTLLRLMRRAGCTLIQYGVESGAEGVLRTTDKRQPLADVERAVAEAHAVGMRTLGYFLLGLPGERPQDRRETVAFARRLGTTYASFQVATPYATTPYYRDAGLAEPFPDVFPDMDGDALRREARQATLGYHLAPRYLARRLTGPGRRHGLREAGLLARYAVSALAG